MKNITIAIILLVLIVFSGCKKDFLERPPQSLNVATFYTSPENLKAATAPLYCAVWFDYNTRPALLLGDFRAGNIYAPYFYPQYVDFTASTTDDNLLGAWSSFYVVISQAGTVYANIRNYATGVTEEEKNAAMAEALFMRGTAYFYLVRLWGPVPIIDDNTQLVKDAKVPLRPVEDVYKYIIRDLNFAVKHLPETAEKGRLTKWAAEGMLAKVYLARSGWGSTDGKRNQADLDSAVSYSSDVCHNYPFGLLPNYADLYKYKFNNNQESLFSLQWVPLGAWGTQNATLSDLAFSQDVVGGAKGGVSAWGSGRASYDVLKAYEPNDTIRRNATFMTDKTHYNDINMAGGGYTYLESTATSDTATSAPFKKYVPGGPDDENDGKVATMSSPLTTYMLRLADVYLVYAEASLGNDPSLTSGDALDYFNKVRERAKMPALASVTLDDIFYERRIELAMEGQLWYDMVTWSYFRPNYIVNMINNQHRSASYQYIKQSDGNLNIWVDVEPTNPVNNFTIDRIMLPIPESEAIADPLLSQPPVPYEFN